MTRVTILKQITMVFPDIKKIPKRHLTLVQNAIVFAAKHLSEGELLTDEEHNQLMEELVPGITKMDPRARALRAYRGREDLTQAELAKKSGNSQSNIAAMESGKRPIGLAVAKKLSRILNCRLERLL